MKRKLVDTLSGARYIVYENGYVERAGTSHIEYSLHQYEQGHLQFGRDSFDELVEGFFIYWIGEVEGERETIRSSRITNITEDSGL